jgi:predicted transcriptional regulator
LNTERPEVTPLADKLDRERRDARREALAAGARIEPTEEERRNGWTTETLTAYLAERAAGQSLAVDVNSLHRRNARRPDEANHRYNPRRWRG